MTRQPSRATRTHRPVTFAGGFAFVAAVVFALMSTKGPVFSIRVRRGPMHGDFIDDRWVQAAFIVSGVLLIAATWGSFQRMRSDRTLLAPLTVVLVGIAASTVWSVAPSRTRDQAAMMVVGTVAALLVGWRLRVGEMLSVWWVATHIGVALSLLALARGWTYSRGDLGLPAGIYFNRNSLGAVAALGLLTSIVAALGLLQARPRRPGFAVALALVAVLDAELLRRTESATPIAALAIAAVLCLGLRLAGRARTLSNRAATAAVSSLFVLVLAVFVALALRGRRVRTGPLSGRDVVWDIVLSFVGRRPLQGWGFNAVWTRTDMMVELYSRGGLVYEAHNGLLEVLVGAGIVTAAALFVVGGVAVARSVRLLRSDLGWIASWPAIAAIYCLLVNLTESYVGANLHPWLLLVMSLAQLGQSNTARPTSYEGGSDERSGPVA